MVLLFSCKKNEPFDGTFELSGTVRDELTGKPIANADVEIIERERGWIVGYAGKLVGSQIANKQGEFVISFPAKQVSYFYEIVATENNKYFEDNTPPRVIITKEGKGRQDVTLIPYGYLTFIIKGNKKGWKLGTNKVGTWHMGVDTSKTSFEYPNEISKVTYWVYDNNDIEIFRKTDLVFIPPPPDTTYYLIEF